MEETEAFKPLLTSLGELQITTTVLKALLLGVQLIDVVQWIVETFFACVSSMHLWRRTLAS